MELFEFKIYANSLHLLFLCPVTKKDKIEKVIFPATDFYQHTIARSMCLLG